MADTLEIRLGSSAPQRRPSLSNIDFKKLLAPLVKDIANAAAIEAGIYQPVDDNKVEVADRLILALAAVKDMKGAGPSYKFTVGTDVAAAVGQITAGLAGEGGRVVPDAARYVRTALNRAIRKGVSVQLVNGSTTPVFNRDNLAPLIATHPTRKLDMEIGVKLIRVGGKKPLARIQLLGTGQVVTAKLSGATAARDLGKHLYHRAVLTGCGEWVIDPKQFYRPTRLLTFEVSGYRLLEPIGTERLFDRLTEAAGGVWDDADPGNPRETDKEEALEDAS